MWHMTCDMWQMICETWHGTWDTWRMTHDRWWTLCQNFRSLALTIWELWCFEDLEKQEVNSLSEWINQYFTTLFVQQLLALPVSAKDMKNKNIFFIPNKSYVIESHRCSNCGIKPLIKCFIGSDHSDTNQPDHCMHKDQV